MSTSDLGWRESILASFTPEVAAFARLTIVADPDGLLAEERVVEEIRCRGFDLIEFDDPVSFRYAYESRFRNARDGGEPTSLVILLRAPGQAAESLPYDLFEEARRSSRVLSFALAVLFSNLAPEVVTSLDRADLDALYLAQRTHEPGMLGRNDSSDFVLHHVFQVFPGLIKSAADLLVVLLRRHYRGRKVPAPLDRRLLQILGRSKRFADWPLGELLAARGAFFEFLQERWPMFLRSLMPVAGAVEIAEPTGLRYPGPAVLPFDHPDVRIFIDNLFDESHLEPVPPLSNAAAPEAWMRAGIKVESESERTMRRLKKLTAVLREQIPGEAATHREWVDFAFRWAGWLTLRFRPEVTGPDAEPCETLHDKVEAGFRAWMCARYDSLHNLPYLPKPVMVHQIPAYLDHVRTRPAAVAPRLALIVIDGLALDQWLILKDFLRRYRLEEDGAFAWVPTLTQITRQSIFAGEAPLFFARTIGHTSAEKSRWSRLWIDRGLKKEEIFYVAPQGKKEETGEYQDAVLEAADHPKCRVLGAVIGTVDQNMHQTDMGTTWMHDMVRNWARGGGLQKILDRLLEHGFEVYLTADHGNVWGRGIGKPDVGSTAKQRGERAHLFEHEAIRASVHEDFPGSLEWPRHGLPADLWALIAPDRACFMKTGHAAVSHGGIALEEVVVPFIHVRGRS